MGQSDKKTPVKQTSKGKADIGGSFSLFDLDGNIFDETKLKNSYYLIYFGFVNCPDICPLTMHKLNRALEKIKKMPEAKFFDLKALFVSVDPDRDNSQKIKKYTEKII